MIQAFITSCPSAGALFVSGQFVFLSATLALAYSLTVSPLPPLSFLSLSLFPFLPARASPRDNNHSLPSPTSFTTSPVGKGPRPLPMPPGSSPNISSHYPLKCLIPTSFKSPPTLASTGSKPYPEQCVTLPILSFISHVIPVCRP